jgi:hypothetical protein
MPELLDWAEAYVRHRDLFEKRILSIEKKENLLIIKNKDNSTTTCLVADSLDEIILAAAEKEKKALLVTRNLKANLDFLVKHWLRFAKLPGLKLVFANVKQNEKWVLLPHSHHAVADPDSLALGLQAMFEAVPEG